MHLPIIIFSILGALIVPKCSVSNAFGINCDIRITRCSMSNPCKNQGTCINTNDNIYGYRCQYDHEICKSNSCWNNGKQLHFFSFSIDNKSFDLLT